MELVAITALSPETALALKTGLRVTHFVGLVLGLGAATLLDLIILRFLATRRVTTDCCSIVEYSTKVVTVGLACLWVSGIGFMLYYSLFDPVKLGNQKIWAKIAIVAILTLNGAFIHHSVLPIIRRSIGRSLFDGLSSTQRGLLLASGVVSGTSWYVPLLLGSVPQLNFVVPAWMILGTYAVLLIVGICITQGVARVALSPVGTFRISQEQRQQETPVNVGQAAYGAMPYIVSVNVPRSKYVDMQRRPEDVIGIMAYRAHTQTMVHPRRAHAGSAVGAPAKETRGPAREARVEIARGAV